MSVSTCTCTCPACGMALLFSTWISGPGGAASVLLSFLGRYLVLYIRQFGQFGLNGFRQGQIRFSQLHISLDPDKLESCNFVCSLITAMHGFAKVAVIAKSVPK